MERQELPIVGESRCDYLRWKGLYVEGEWDPTVPPGGNDRLFWCLHTYNCLGPDGKIADDYECNPSRACYKPL
jgi:hypothetical protein